jgi:hypothetical protein
MGVKKYDVTEVLVAQSDNINCATFLQLHNDFVQKECV